jgi:UDP-N-acetylmuramyl pentapeptide phosphotransferase/UDP-N-acetylglucosamine-1-phosphate transferase
MLLSKSVTLGMAVAGMSFALSMLIIYSQKWHGKHSHDHDIYGVQKVHTTAVPRIGGLAVIGGILLGIGLFVFFYPGEIKATRVSKILMLLAASLPAFIAGIVEDVTKKVSVRVRLAATICSALIASVLLGATVDELDIWGIDTLLTVAPIAIMVTAVVVAGGANAINIIDGFNGLSGSVIAIMAAALGVVAWQVGDGFVVLISTVACAAALGFLMVNYPSGKLFLGDGGAYFLGFWVAETAVLLLLRNHSVNAWQVLSICAFPVIEVLFSIYRRKFIMNVNAGAPDALHLHALVYRRFVSRFVSVKASQPWRRNAAVSFVMVPWIAIAAIVSVLAGTTIIGAMAIVGVQIVAYIAVYSRLVRGRWPPRPAVLPIKHGEVNEVSSVVVPPAQRTS